MTIHPDTLRALQQENGRLYDENQTLRAELYRLRQAISALSDIQQSLDSITPQSDVLVLLRKILASALDAIDSANGSLQLLDEDSGELVFVEVLGPERDQLIGYRLPLGEGIAGWVASNRAPRLVPDVHKDVRFSPQVDETIGFRTNSLICVPIVDGERTLGVIEVVNTRSGDPFKETDLDIMLLVACLAGMAFGRVEGFGPRATNNA